MFGCNYDNLDNNDYHHDKYIIINNNYILRMRSGFRLCCWLLLPGIRLQLSGSACLSR